jgi:hypothetical protein
VDKIRGTITTEANDGKTPAGPKNKGPDKKVVKDTATTPIATATGTMTDWNDLSAKVVAKRDPAAAAGTHAKATASVTMTAEHEFKSEDDKLYLHVKAKITPTLTDAGKATVTVSGKILSGGTEAAKIEKTYKLSMAPNVVPITINIDGGQPATVLLSKEANEKEPPGAVSFKKIAKGKYTVEFVLSVEATGDAEEVNVTTEWGIHHH